MLEWKHNEPPSIKVLLFDCNVEAYLRMNETSAMKPILFPRHIITGLSMKYIAEGVSRKDDLVISTTALALSGMS